MAVRPRAGVDRLLRAAGPLVVQRWVPAALLVVIALVDVLLDRLVLPILPTGLLDWSAHLSTTGLLLLAGRRLGLRLPPPNALVVLAASVLIDLDHVALYAAVPGVEAAGGRPFTHSLVTVGVLLLLAGLLRRRVLLLVAGGVVAHLLRDVATGPGVPLLWPADVVVRVPYLPYAVVLLVLAAVATARREQATGPAGRGGRSAERDRAARLL